MHLVMHASYSYARKFVLRKIMAPPSNSMHVLQIHMQLFFVCMCVNRNVKEQKDFMRYTCMEQWLKDTYPQRILAVKH
jgi:hypothetical protein|uniref:Uncharacterized protein n=1 Tax=Populus trichocarpa TaxID=3694 RepID=U5G7C0_POPTR